MLRRLSYRFSDLGYFFSDLFHWFGERRRRLLYLLASLLGLAAIGVGGYLVADSRTEEEAATAPAPEIIVRQADEPEQTDEAADLGFPAFATKNTTRIASADSIATAAAVALAVRPSTGGVAGPAAVSLVDVADWQAGIAAASLVGPPIGAPILVTDGEEIPALTASALEALEPTGAESTDDRQAFVIGDAARPQGLDALAVEGSDPAEIAAAVAALRTRLTGSKPEHIVVVSLEDPAIAMPAAAWAARAGDPVLFVEPDSIPEATAGALRRNPEAPVYVLGSEEAISDGVLRQIEKVGSDAQRVGAEGPEENAIAFARYDDDTFGWNINDPGHGLVVASAARPLDGAVAAPLSASGTWGPLLVTEDPAAVSEQLRGYLLDLKPGYEDDPTRALYNRIWVIGDTEAISVAAQAQLDELAELAQIGSGSGEPPAGGAGVGQDD